MRFSTLQRKLVAGVLLLFLLPTLLGAAILAALGRSGVFETNPSALLTTILVGLVLLTGYIGIMAYVIGRLLVRTLQQMQLGAELMVSVNPDHRLEVRTGDELELLATEINRMAARLSDTRAQLEREVARATSDLAVERARLSAVIETLAEGVLLATPEGRVTLANRAASDLLGSQLLGADLFDLVDREKVIHFLEQLRGSSGGAERFSLQTPGGLVLAAAMTPFLDQSKRLVGFSLVLRDMTSAVVDDDVRRQVLASTLQDLRNPLASIRSLTENLLDADLVPRPAAGLLRAVHSEALRLSDLVKALGQPGQLGLAPAAWRFESIAVADLLAMAQRRFARQGGSASALKLPSDLGPLPGARVEVAMLSSALARLFAVLLERRLAAEPLRLRVSLRGQVLLIDSSLAGSASVAELEACLDEAPRGEAGQQLTPRQIVQQHAGEVWAFSNEDRLGFRLTLPTVASTDLPPSGETPAANSPALVGAGLKSGWPENPTDAEPDRPEFYDFSLFEQMDHQVAAADRDRRLDELTYVVFDCETTGLSPETGDRIVSLAGVRVRRGVVKSGETFDALVNPGRKIPAASIRFHGITEGMVADCPPLEVVLPTFLRFAEGAVLVGHEVGFDLRCLGAETARLRLPPVTDGHPFLDTLLLSELVHGPLERHGLELVAARLGVGVRGRHSALGDALTTADVLARLIELLLKRDVQTLGQALEHSRRLRGGRLQGLARELSR